MRIIGSLKSEEDAFLFQAHLQLKGIESACHKGNDLWEIWIYDEDQIEKGKAELDAFLRSPKEFFEKRGKPTRVRADGLDESSVSEKASPLRRRGAQLTYALIVLCAVIFYIQRISLDKEQKDIASSGYLFGISKLTTKLLIDYPEAYQDLQKQIRASGAAERKQLEDLALPDRLSRVRSQLSAYWQGLTYLLLNWPDSRATLKVPLLKQVRQGEVWRLFTPILLHGGFFHILFNMLWLYFLGRHIEPRSGRGKYLIITLCIALVSNLCQYFMGGPFFLGFSGVIMGYAGFIWMRQKCYPWEGYPIPKAVFIFLAVYTLALCGIGIVSFILQWMRVANVPFFVANTGHVVGGATGILLGRLAFFGRRVGKQ